MMVRFASTDFRLLPGPNSYRQILGYQPRARTEHRAIFRLFLFTGPSYVICTTYVSFPNSSNPTFTYFTSATDGSQTMQPIQHTSYMRTSNKYCRPLASHGSSCPPRHEVLDRRDRLHFCDSSCIENRKVFRSLYLVAYCTVQASEQHK